jgi:hypothetical protein
MLSSCARLLVPVLGLPLFFLAACAGPEFTIGDGTTTTGGPTTSSGTSSGTAGGGGAGGDTGTGAGGTGGASGTPCTVEADCPEITCQTASCPSGVCHYAPVFQGTPCDGGFCTNEATCVQCLTIDQCVPKPCKLPLACDSGQCVYMNHVEGTLCEGDDQCDGAGNCLDCIDGEGCIGDCPQAVTCVCNSMNVCEPAT